MTFFKTASYVFLADEKPWPRRIGLLALGGLPALTWMLFSLVYYGAIAPNTALAKVMTGIPATEYLAQAIQYTRHTLATDTITLLLLLAGCLAGFWQSSWRWRALSSGLLLWFAYLALVGADYMAGRFFSIPVLFAVLILARVLRDQPFQKPGVVLLVALLFALPQLRFTLFSPVTYNNWEISPSGIADERGYYYPATGLRPVLRSDNAQHPWLLLWAALKEAITSGGGKGVYVACQIGMAPYAAGADTHWIDALALSDAFLARLPARPGVRVGHYERALPPGYPKSVLTQQNHIDDPALARLYDDVVLASTGELFRRERFAAIFRLNTGFHQNAAANFAREAVGLPGLPVHRKDKFSCLGNMSGQAWHVDESLQTTHIVEWLQRQRQ
jgi:arabinofuranosyltransferase